MHATFGTARRVPAMGDPRRAGRAGFLTLGHA